MLVFLSNRLEVRKSDAVYYRKVTDICSTFRLLQGFG